MLLHTVKKKKSKKHTLCSPLCSGIVVPFFICLSKKKDQE